MALREFGAGFVVGFGTGVVAREAFPVARELMAPMVRVLSKSGVRVFERARETMARMGESLEDILAEVRVERRRKRIKGKHGVKGRRAAKVAEVVPLHRKAGVSA